MEATTPAASAAAVIRSVFVLIFVVLMLPCVMGLSQKVIDVSILYLNVFGTAVFPLFTWKIAYPREKRSIVAVQQVPRIITDTLSFEEERVAT